MSLNIKFKKTKIMKDKDKEETNESKDSSEGKAWEINGKREKEKTERSENEES
tara:strand:+ start:21989 stop:22147 length:159 start_codon:yes stop_codon:yes gene_type:complete